MAYTIQCFEPSGRPAQVSLDVESGESFIVYAMQDNLDEEGKNLRTSVLRKGTEAAPIGGTLLFEVDVNSMPGRALPGLRVRRLASKIGVEIIRPDLRSRMAPAMELRSGSRYEVSLLDMRVISFSIQVAAQVLQGAAAVASSGSVMRRTSPAKDLPTAVFWLVPTLGNIASDPKARVASWFMRTAKKLGLSPAIFTVLLATGVMVGGALYVAWRQKNVADDATAAAAEAASALEATSANLDAALLAQSACMTERKAMAKALGELEELMKLQATAALQAAISVTAAMEQGGARMGKDEVLAYDAQANGNILTYVVAEMKRLRSAPEGTERCQAQQPVLGQDLPSYFLLWHPDENLVCPLDYAMITGGVDRAGSWGLSKRAANEFGIPTGAETSGDPRMMDRWEASTMMSGLRSIVTAILTAETATRPPVSPSQVHLWALALWDAYNQMADPAEGALNKEAEACVSDLIMDIHTKSDPSSPGDPVLPDITLVATGEALGVIRPTSGCPWPADSVQVGAKGALRSVAHYANLQIAMEEGK